MATKLRRGRVDAVMGRPEKTFTVRQIDKVRSMVERGATRVQIAKALGVTSATLRVLLLRQGYEIVTRLTLERVQGTHSCALEGV